MYLRISTWFPSNVLNAFEYMYECYVSIFISNLSDLQFYFWIRNDLVFVKRNGINGFQFNRTPPPLPAPEAMLLRKQ